MELANISIGKIIQEKGKEMDINSVTPRDVIKIVEQNPNLTPLERKKGLAIALVHLYYGDKKMQNFGPAVAVLSTLWEFSQFINPAIPDFDPQFIVDINENPAAFVNVK